MVASLVVGRSVDVVNEVALDCAFLRGEFETELLLQGVEERGPVAEVGGESLAGDVGW